jgi:dTDP-glucose pyrophosphorylase
MAKRTRRNASQPPVRGVPSRGTLRGVLTLAGEGTRLLPWSRGLRKEFLPLFDRGMNHAPVLKPVAHIVLETLAEAGISDVTLVVQPRDLSTVRNYFTTDRRFLERHNHHPDRLTETRRLHERLRRLRLRYAIQPVPIGFGDAVLRAERSVGGHPFLLHASDAILEEPDRGALPRAMGELLVSERLDAVLLVRRVADPRRYGVVEGRPSGRFRGWRRIEVSGMEEKPERPRSRWAATAVYAFSPRLFSALRRARRRTPTGAELEVTTGIQEMLRAGGRVSALVIDRPTAWRSVGSPEGYLRALRGTHRTHSRRGRA